MSNSMWRGVQRRARRGAWRRRRGRSRCRGRRAAHPHVAQLLEQLVQAPGEDRPATVDPDERRRRIRRVALEDLVGDPRERAADFLLAEYDLLVRAASLPSWPLGTGLKEWRRIYQVGATASVGVRSRSVSGRVSGRSRAWRSDQRTQLRPAALREAGPRSCRSRAGPRSPRTPRGPRRAARRRRSGSRQWVSASSRTSASRASSAAWRAVLWEVSRARCGLLLGERGLVHEHVGLVRGDRQRLARRGVAGEDDLAALAWPAP